MNGFDLRITPARPDLAAAHLAGRVEAARFVEGWPMRIREPIAPLHRAGASDSPLDTQALHGETVTVYEATEEGWSWCQLETDGYVGFVPSDALAPPGPPPTHRVAELRSFVYPGPSIKLPPLALLSQGSRVAVVRATDAFAVTDAGGYIFARHLAPIGAVEPDPLAVAERFLGTPYLWGGRSSIGLDCSALVQLALAACGIAAPRDSDQQEAALGRPLLPQETPRGGDLVFWKGHVGFVAGPDRLLHANGHHMLVVEEPFSQARERILAKTGADITVIKRLEQVPTSAPGED